MTNAPGARARSEEWRLGPAGTGPRIRMFFALDGTAAFRLAWRVPEAGRAFRQAVTAPDRRLSD